MAEDGSVSSVSGSDFIGYETSVTIDRVCMPSSAVLSDAFASALESISSSMQSGEFASMVSDIENVSLDLYRIGNGYSARLPSQ